MINRRQGQDRSGPEPIGEVLSRLFVARGWGRKQDRLRLEAAWTAAVGPEAAANTRVGGLKRGVLEVEVIGAVLMQELAHFRKRPILQKLREQLPGVTVSDLRFRAGG
jgi:predicted nucleic acid-binding Zn ribbon protein